MAKVVQAGSSRMYREKPKHKRPGINSKCKTSHNKNSKHYVKAYRGQGR